MIPKFDPTVPHSPVVLKQVEKRAASAQLRVADAITAFAGSMMFVYIHIAAFAIWMLVFEKSPWPTLTLIVSLEAIFLSTFVMIGQNRQASFQQAKADHDYSEEEALLKENTDLNADHPPAHPRAARSGVCRAGIAAGSAAPDDRQRVTAARTRRSNRSATAATAAPTTPSSQ